MTWCCFWFISYSVVANLKTAKITSAKLLCYLLLNLALTADYDRQHKVCMINFAIFYWIWHWRIRHWVICYVKMWHKNILLGGWVKVVKWKAKFSSSINTLENIYLWLALIFCVHMYWKHGYMTNQIMKIKWKMYKLRNEKNLFVTQMFLGINLFFAE